jgi:uncharacterized damage-inducible protein DinB
MDAVLQGPRFRASTGGPARVALPVLDPRIDPEPSADERVTLNGFLDYYRATILTKIDGLTDEQARTRFVDSDTTLLGLVRHLTEVERNWFRRRLRGEDAPPRYYSEADPDGDFHPGLDWTIAEAVATYEQECAVSRVIVADTATLDELTVVPIRGYDAPVSLRWILVHMIEETARHAGHADILRELIDGSTGD